MKTGWKAAGILLLMLLLCLVSAAAAAEHGTAETAQPIQPGVSVTDRLEGGGAQNYYRFETAKPGWVTVTFTHRKVRDSAAVWQLKMADRDHIDPMGFFARFQGLLAAEFAEKGPASSATCRIGIPAGTWYLRVHSDAPSGADYTLTVRFTASSLWEREPNDTAEESTAIRAGKEYGGVLATAADSFCRPADYYCFTLKEDAYVTLMFGHEPLKSGKKLWSFSLEDRTQKLLYGKTYTGNSPAEDISGLIRLSAGKYYLAVNCCIGGDGSAAYSETPYRISVRIQPDSHAVKGGIYRLNHANQTAELTAPESRSAEALVIPASFRVNGVRYRVTGIAENACKGMKKLKELTLGKYVKTIGASAFRRCRSLRRINVLTAKLKTAGMGARAFLGVHEKVRVVCPAEKLEAYRKLFQAGGVGSGAIFQAEE